MLAIRAKTLHLGVANYCWFTDPGKALCLRLAGTPTADRPLIGMCDSARCPQARTTPATDPYGTRPCRARLEAQRDRAVRVLADIDAAGTPVSTDAEGNRDGAAQRPDPWTEGSRDHAGAIVGPRDARIDRLEQQVHQLKSRLSTAEQNNVNLTAFRTQALSRLAAQREEITRLRATSTT